MGSHAGDLLCADDEGCPTARKASTLKRAAGEGGDPGRMNSVRKTDVGKRRTRRMGSQKVRCGQDGKKESGLGKSQFGYMTTITVMWQTTKMVQDGWTDRHEIMNGCAGIFSSIAEIFEGQRKRIQQRMADRNGPLKCVHYENLEMHKKAVEEGGKCRL